MSIALKTLDYPIIHKDGYSPKWSNVMTARELFYVKLLMPLAVECIW